MSSLPQKPRKLKRAVIKEELVELLGDYKKAIILNQFLYWTERMRDTDKFIQEEKERSAKSNIDLNIELQHGWIYKTADELSKETMLGLSNTSIGKHINDIVEMGYLDKRNNPKHKWDRTFQYRVNILKIQEDLFMIGYSLEGYSLAYAFKDIGNGYKETSNQSKDTSNHNQENGMQYQRLLTENTIDNNTNNNKDNIYSVDRKSALRYDWINDKDF